MNEDFLKIISRFADVGSRLTAASELAELIHAEEIFCFVFDPGVNIFLPAPGFQQTLENTNEWQRFLAASQNQSCFRGSIVLHGNIKKDAVGISSKNGCVLVLINFKHDDITLGRLKTIFALIAALMKTEAFNLEIESKIKMVEQSSGVAEPLAKELDSMRTKLQLALKTEEEFLSAASHELKTPITSINAFIQILQSIYPETSIEKQTHYIVTRIKFQVDRLIRLMGDLLDATKIRTGTLKLNVEEVSLDQVVDNLIRDYSFPVTTHKIIKKGSIIGKVSCDKDRIQQVISNLLDNAIKYSPTSDNIIISTGRDKNNVLFSVQDFGTGIEPESKNKIFDRFFRAHGEDSGNLSSLGLGLYISADIIKRHNGKIWVDSEPGKGSTFHFSLPGNI
jgi:signal transduction histidine kinase